MLIAILVIEIVSLLVVCWLFAEVFALSERTLRHLREFDGGVARSFDSIDRQLAALRDELAAPRCEFGNCRRRAVFEIELSPDTLMYTCSEHDIWRGDEHTYRRALPGAA